MKIEGKEVKETEAIEQLHDDILQGRKTNDYEQILNGSFADSIEYTLNGTVYCCHDSTIEEPMYYVDQHFNCIHLVSGDLFSELSVIGDQCRLRTPNRFLFVNTKDFRKINCEVYYGTKREYEYFHMYLSAFPVILPYDKFTTHKFVTIPFDFDNKIICRIENFVDVHGKELQRIIDSENKRINDARLKRTPV